jgi:hypothetical protein
MSQESSSPVKPGGTGFLELGLPGAGGRGELAVMFIRPESRTEAPSGGGHLVRASPSHHSRRRNEMRCQDLMKPDLLSDIVLVGSGALMFISLLLVVVAALART